MGVVVIALDGGVLDGAVHSLDLAVGPGMLGLGQPMIDVVWAQAYSKACAGRARPRRSALMSGGPIHVRRRIGEVDAVVGEHGVDLVGHGFDQASQEVGGGRACAAFSCSSTKANLEVRSMATNR